MSEMTQILHAVEQGDPKAAEQLLPLVYQELRKLAAQRLAQEKPGQTLQATALVHEAYLRLVDIKQQQRWDSRGHFFVAAAEAMRRILVEQARRKQRLKRGGGRKRLPLEEIELASGLPQDDLLVLDEALARLKGEDADMARLVHLRFFAGMNHEEVASLLGISAVTARRKWRFARAWLRRQMRGTAENEEGDETD